MTAAGAAPKIVFVSDLQATIILAAATNARSHTQALQSLLDVLNHLGVESLSHRKADDSMHVMPFSLDGCIQHIM